MTLARLLSLQILIGMTSHLPYTSNGIKLWSDRILSARGALHYQTLCSIPCIVLGFLPTALARVPLLEVQFDIACCVAAIRIYFNRVTETSYPTDERRDALSNVIQHVKLINAASCQWHFVRSCKYGLSCIVV
jgi:hypothetical protein